MGMKRLGGALLLAALVLGLTEAALRIGAPRSAWSFTPDRPAGSQHLPDRGQPIYRPVHSGSPHWTAVHDERGLRREGPLSPEPAPGTWRLLALGDSWMYGIGVDQHASVPAVLEEILPKRLGVQRVEVINAGVPSGSAFEMLFWWQRLSETLAFDGVLLGKPHNRSRQVMLRPTRAAWYRSYLGKSQPDLRLLAFGRWLWASSPFDRATGLRRGDPDTAEETDLVHLATQAQAAGLGVWMLFWPTTMEGALGGRRIDERHWYRAMDAAGVPYAGHALGEWTCWGTQDTFHPSEAGYRALAHVVGDLVVTGKSSRTLSTMPGCGEF